MMNLIEKKVLMLIALLSVLFLSSMAFAAEFEGFWQVQG